MAQIKIGPEFFAKAKNDYSDWHWALVREFFQNCVDCGSSRITFDVTERDGKTIVVVTNNGRPMSQDILVNKLLSLGSSGKEFNGTVGGFGKAKEILYFCHVNYTIETGNLICIGSGATYELDVTDRPFKGTRSTIEIDGRHSAILTEYAKRFVSFSQVSARFILNGCEYDLNLRRGYFRRDLSFGKVYTNRQYENLMVVRIGGIPMFLRHCKFEGCVIVELNGTSLQNLTSNRDGLHYRASSEMESFLYELTTNKRKALKQNATQYLKYAGSKLRATKGLLQKAQVVLSGLVPTAAKAVAGVSDADCGYDETANIQNLPASQRRTLQIASSFVIKNETGKVVRPQYRPEHQGFCIYAFRLVMIWTQLLIKLHEIFKMDEEFSVGFLFGDNETEALYEKSSEHGVLYLINPVKIDGNKWLRRYRCGCKEDLNQLLSTALHEIVHGMGYGEHNEDYSSKLTDAVAKVLNQQTEVRKCFRVGV